MRAPSGISTDGVRHVTGRLDPAMKGKSQFARGVVHLARPLPIPREMLVAEHGHGASAVAKHLHDLFEELVARILRLPFFVARIIAVLAHHHHAIHRQLASAERQGLGDGGSRSSSLGCRAPRSRLRSVAPT